MGHQFIFRKSDGTYDDDDIARLIDYINKKSAAYASQCAYGGAQDFTQTLASETAYKLTLAALKNPTISSSLVAITVNSVGAALQERYRQGRPYTSPHTVAGQRITFSKRFNSALKNFCVANGREPTSRERREIGQKIIDEWPNQRVKPAPDVLGFIPRPLDIDTAATTILAPDSGDADRAARLYDLIVHCDATAATPSVAVMQARRIVWESLTPHIPIRSLPPAIVRASLATIRHHTDIAAYARTWAASPRSVSLLLFSPFAIHALSDRDDIADALLISPVLAPRLLAQAYKNSASLFLTEQGKKQVAKERQARKKFKASAHTQEATSSSSHPRE